MTTIHVQTLARIGILLLLVLVAGAPESLGQQSGVPASADEIGTTGDGYTQGLSEDERAIRVALQTPYPFERMDALPVLREWFKSELDLALDLRVPDTQSRRMDMHLEFFTDSTRPPLAVLEDICRVSGLQLSVPQERYILLAPVDDREATRQTSAFGAYRKLFSFKFGGRDDLDWLESMAVWHGSQALLDPPSAVPCDYADGYPGVAPVCSFPSHGFGLHDMSGNVWEWCADEVVGLQGRSRSAGPHIVRGGSWRTYLRANLRCAARNWTWAEHDSDQDVGFRVAVDLAR